MYLPLVAIGLVLTATGLLTPDKNRANNGSQPKPKQGTGQSNEPSNHENPGIDDSGGSVVNSGREVDREPGLSQIVKEESQHDAEQRSNGNNPVDPGDSGGN